MSVSDAPPDTERLSKLVTNTAASCISCAFNCVCIYANDLEATSAFYSGVLGLKEIQDQTLSHDTKLFEFSNGCKLQIVGSVDLRLENRGSNYFMISSSDFDATIKFLIVNGIHWGARDGEPRKVTVRPDGIRQIFLEDPDHNLIEVNDGPPKGLVPFSPPWFLPPGSYQT